MRIEVCLRTVAFGTVPTERTLAGQKSVRHVPGLVCQLCAPPLRAAASVFGQISSFVPSSITWPDGMLK